MDLSSVATAIFTASLAIPASIYGAIRWIRRTDAADHAERFANDWHQKVIERQDREAERLRAEIARLGELITQGHARILELERENKVKRDIIRALVNDMSLVKRDKLDPHELQTDVYRGHI
jgi:hypothetical protein